MQVYSLTLNNSSRLTYFNSDKLDLIKSHVPSLSFRITNVGYAEGYSRLLKRRLCLHAIIIGDHSLSTHHKDGNKLNNRTENLLICSDSDNSCARLAPISNTSGYKNVYFDRSRTKQQWKVLIMKDRKKINYGRYYTLREAVIASNEAMLKYHGAFARLNIVPEE